MPESDSSVDMKRLGALAGVFVLVALLWNTPVVTPLKIVVVLLHEISHGIAAVLTGGEIVRIEINADQGGVCYTRGGSRFVTLSAGYLGSMLWGGFITVLASRWKADRALSIGIGIGVGLVTAIYVRSWFGFGFALVFAVAMIAAGWKLSHDANDWILKTIGVTSILYAPLDIISDVIARPGLRSDAVMLAEVTHVPSLVWGCIWVVAALVAAAGFLWLSVARSPFSGAET